MRLRTHRRSLVIWSPSTGSAGRYGTPRFTRPTRIRRIHRWIHTGALLMLIGVMRLARAARPWWRPLLAGGVLTGFGVVAAVVWGLVILPGLLLLMSAALIPARPKTRRTQRAEVEHELGVFSHPAQLRLASQAIALYDKQFPG
jgi:hypothetical protein